MQVLLRHAQAGPHTFETQFHIGPGEGKGVAYRDGLSVLDPLVHSPKMRVPQVQSQAVDEARDQRELFGRADRTTNAGRLSGPGLPPSRDVFQGLAKVELLQGLVKTHFESR